MRHSEEQFLTNGLTATDMTTATREDRAPLAVYGARDVAYIVTAWIVVGIALTTANLMRVQSQLGGTPLLSANDRSRWSTVRSLVDHGTFQLDQVVLLPDGKRNREWYSIDMVKHPGRDGQDHYYSSKPPLFPVMVAGLYYLFQKATGATLEEQPFYVVRALLLLINIAPLAAFWFLLGRWLLRSGCSLWSANYVMATATLGTLLTPFAVTLNNHLPAAVAVAFASWALLRVAIDGQRSWYYFLLVGFLAGLAGINELPALLFVVMAGVVCFAYRPRTAVWAFTLPVLLWALLFEITNYAAHQSWLPPYAHRQDGPQIGQFTHPMLSDSQERPPPDTLREALSRVVSKPISERAILWPREKTGQWGLWDPGSSVKLALEWQSDGSTVVVRQWDNWYDYPGTYWRQDRKTGVDRGEPNIAVYAFHVLLGHHGIFSLTPVWLISVLGWYRLQRSGVAPLARAAYLIAAVSALCIAFYVTRPSYDRNYGGVSCGMRWTLWLIPLWLYCLLPGVETLEKSALGRLIAWILLGVSVFSVVYASRNPWSHPWLFDYWTALGWLSS